MPENLIFVSSAMLVAMSFHCLPERVFIPFVIYIAPFILWGQQRERFISTKKKTEQESIRWNSFHFWKNSIIPDCVYIPSCKQIRCLGLSTPGSFSYCQSPLLDELLPLNNYTYFQVKILDVCQNDGELYNRFGVACYNRQIAVYIWAEEEMKICFKSIYKKVFWCDIRI